MTARHHPETYRLDWNTREADPGDVLAALPREAPEGFSWESIITGRAACCWEELERDMSALSARFPGTLFTLRIRCTRHAHHSWKQYHLDGTYREEQELPQVQETGTPFLPPWGRLRSAATAA